jgi:hypothetical protein
MINIGDDGKTKHDTEGWKSLETSMRILQHIIEAIGVRLYTFDLNRILKQIKKGVDHINRFVREISYFVMKGIFATSQKIFENNSEELKVHQVAFRAFCDDLVPILAQGLSDNWS